MSVSGYSKHRQTVSSRIDPFLISVLDSPWLDVGAGVFGRAGAGTSVDARAHINSGVSYEACHTDSSCCLSSQRSGTG
jgi:hypothetical protein